MAGVISLCAEQKFRRRSRHGRERELRRGVVRPENRGNDRNRRDSRGRSGDVERPGKTRRGGLRADFEEEIRRGRAAETDKYERYIGENITKNTATRRSRET